MTNQSRRQFIGNVGKSAALAGAASWLPRSIARAASIPADSPTGTIDDVGHVVILTQENRSFDHYFGTLPGVRGFADRFTIPLPDGRSVWEQSDGERIVMPYHLDATAGNAQRVAGRPHTWPDAQDAWQLGRMMNWPAAKGQQAMGHYTEAELRFQFALAEAFTICDAYHCSMQTGTNPNRLFIWTGTNGATAAGVAAVVNEFDALGPADTGYDWTTYPERLQEAGVSWKVYQGLPDNFGDNSLAGFRRFRAANAAIGNDPDGAPFPPFDDAIDAADPLARGIANTMPDGGFLEAFRDDVAAGRLPQVSWIVAPAAYSEHPDPSSPVQGAAYTELVLDALTATPEVWAKTVLLVHFDENDGFFDHVPPPAPPTVASIPEAGGSTVDATDEYFTHPAPEGAVAQPPPDGRPYGLGPRVPLSVISPWSRGGWVCSQVFDHTSIIRFLEARFGVEEPNISQWRRSVCGDLTSAFDFGRAAADELPALPTVGRREAALVRVAQERLDPVPVPAEAAQAPPAQASGPRPSRALPYDLSVSSAVDADGVTLTFSNAGAAGAVFHVYDQLHLDRVPRRYTVGTESKINGVWATAADGGRYDLWLLGPNGFHRHFAGTADVLVELSAATTAETRSVELAIQNGDLEPVEVAVESLFDGVVDLAAVQVEPDGSGAVTIDASATGGWYDVTLRVGDGFVRRLAGRIENGEHGTSDPLQ